MNRRKFVSSVAAAGAVAALPSRLYGATVAPTLKVGLIGCGWWAGMSLNAFYEQGSIEVVSLCDPNSKALEETLEVLKTKQKRSAQQEGYLCSRTRVLMSRIHRRPSSTTPI